VSCYVFGCVFVLVYIVYGFMRYFCGVCVCDGWLGVDVCVDDGVWLVLWGLFLF